MKSKLQNDLISNLAASQFSSIDEVLRAANFILCDDKRLLESAVVVLNDTHNILRIKSNTCDRHFWQVAGSFGKSYICFSSNCPCKSFEEQSYNSIGDQPVICKHLLAIKLGEAVPGYLPEKVKQHAYYKLSCS